MGKVEFVYVSYIRTTPEKLWEALTNGDFSEKYWFGFRVEWEQRGAGPTPLVPAKGMEQKGDHAGEVLACEKYKKLSYTWKVINTPEKASRRDGLSRVTYE